MRGFWNKCIKQENGCWEWTGCCTIMGYGKVNFTHQGVKKKWYVHRLSYYLTHGEIPPKALILHSCDNRRCINPEHLHLGTPQENSNEMVLRGRHNGSKPSTQAQLRRLRDLNPD